MYISIPSRLSRMAGDKCHSCTGYILRSAYRVSIPSSMPHSLKKDSCIFKYYLPWRNTTCFWTLACFANVYLLTARDHLLDTHSWHISHGDFVCVLKLTKGHTYMEWSGIHGSGRDHRCGWLYDLSNKECQLCCLSVSSRCSLVSSYSVSTFSDREWIRKSKKTLPRVVISLAC